ncbi:MAG: low temperature requirement protein A [Thermomicrobiales bacterium]|nr:low temperature requirement protein A [Thermomicrobiales bacterium]
MPQNPFLRQEGARRSTVTPVELFFDLVYVFAITQLSHKLLEHFDVQGALQTAILLLAVWWAWVYTAWFTNWFDPDQRTVRLVLIAGMLASLLMSTSIPEAFSDRGLLFAVAFVALQVGRSLFVIWAARDNRILRTNFVRLVIWSLAAGVLWVAGALTSGSTRELLWVIAVLVDYAAPLVFYAVPGLGRAHTSDWNISGEHMAERAQLFVIIALGESILVTGATFGELPVSWEAVAALVVAFLGSVALWWIYFDRAAGDAAEAIAHSSDPGALGRTAYTYIHLPMIAGIVVSAVGDELQIAHPLGHATPEAAIALLGGPLLFLAGHALFKYVVFHVVSLPRLAAIVLLVLAGVVGQTWPPLAIATAALVVLAGVSVADVRTAHAREQGRVQ